MSISTYAELQAAVASWLHRTDLTAQIPDFIALCEARLNDALLLRTMEQEDTLTATAGSRFIALPTGYVSPIALWRPVGDKRELLTPSTPQQMPYSTALGLPLYWSVDGANIQFDCLVSGVVSIFFRYIKKSNLSASNTTNQLLTDRPDLYLYGTLAEACQYTQDGENLQVWEGKYQAALQSMKDAENRARAMVPLRTEIADLHRERFDINRGY